MGGGVGEVHGAKLVGLLRRALLERPAAVLLLAESGGVRLHEANAGLTAVSEVMRALLDVRASGIPVVVLIGGANGRFRGMGLLGGRAGPGGVGGNRPPERESNTPDSSHPLISYSRLSF